MMNQLKVEWFKLKRFKLFMAICLFLFVIGYFYGYMKMPVSEKADGVLKNVIHDTSFVFIISIVTAWFTGNDFSNRTIHNEIKIGYSRMSILLSRLLMTFLITVFLHGVYIFSTIIGFSVKYGFDRNSFTKKNLVWLFVVMFQLITVQSMVVFLVFLLKKAAVSIAAAVCFSFLTCNVLRNFEDFYISIFNGKIFTLSVFCLAQDNSAQTLILAAIYAAVIHAVVFVCTYRIFRKAKIE